MRQAVIASTVSCGRACCGAFTDTHGAITGGCRMGHRTRWTPELAEGPTHVGVRRSLAYWNQEFQRIHCICLNSLKAPE